ncbi:nitrogen fixation protein NifR, partial [Staphylococcus aureus]
MGRPQQREIGFPISTDNASWVGRRNKFYVNNH